MYHRVVSLDLHTNAAKTASEFVTAYRDFCKRIDTELAVGAPETPNEPPQFFLSDETLAISEAPKTCETKYNHMLPEIKTNDDWEALKKFAKQNQIEAIFAGIKYDKSDARIKFVSTNTQMPNLFTRYKYRKPDYSYTEVPIISADALNYMNLRPNFVYEPTKGDGVIVAGQPALMEKRSRIVCQFAKHKHRQDRQNMYTLQLTSHVCNRDIPRLEEMVKSLRKEIRVFKHFSEHSYDEDDDTQKDQMLNDKRVRHLDNQITCPDQPDNLTSQIAEIFIAQTHKYHKLFNISHIIAQRYLQFELLSEFDSIVNFDDFILNSNGPGLYSPDNTISDVLMKVNCILPQQNITKESLINSNLEQLFDIDHTNFINNIKSHLRIPIRHDRTVQNMNTHKQTFTNQTVIADNVYLSEMSNKTDIPLTNNCPLIESIPILSIIDLFHNEAQKYKSSLNMPEAITYKILQYELLSDYNLQVPIGVLLFNKNWANYYPTNNPFVQLIIDIDCHLTNKTYTESEVLSSNITFLAKADHSSFIDQIKAHLGLPIRFTKIPQLEKDLIYKARKMAMFETNESLRRGKTYLVSKLYLLDKILEQQNEYVHYNGSLFQYLSQKNNIDDPEQTLLSEPISLHSPRKKRSPIFLTLVQLALAQQQRIEEAKQYLIDKANDCNPELYKTFETILSRYADVKGLYNVQTCDPELLRLFNLLAANYHDINGSPSQPNIISDSINSNTTNGEVDQLNRLLAAYNSSNQDDAPNLRTILTRAIMLTTAREYLKLNPNTNSDQTPDVKDLTLQRNKRFIVGGFALHYALQNSEAIANLSSVQLMHSHSINALLDNQILIKESNNELREQIFHLRNITNMHDYAIKAMFAEKDTKEACERLNDIVQNSLLKLANAITEALAHRTSPFVLSTSDLHDIALRERKRKLLLSTNIDEIYTQLYRNESTYVFHFSVPVIDDKSSYRLYATRNFPIFNPDGKAYRIIPDIKYLGISADTTKYIELTESEYRDCTTKTFCATSNSPNSFNNKASCTALSFRTNEIHCEKQEDIDAHPFFATYDTVTFHSVPQNYSVDIICPINNARNAKAPVRGDRILSGIGQIHINANCFMKLSDDRTIESHHLPEKSTDLGVGTITDALQNVIQPETYLVPWTNNSYWADKPMPPELDLNVTPYKIEDFLRYTFDPQQFTQHTLRTSIIIVVVSVLFGICCFFSRDCLRWAKTFFLVSNPKKYWTQVKGLHVPYFDKMPPQQQTGNRSFLDRHTALRRIFGVRRRTDEPQVNFSNQEEEMKVFITNTHNSSPTIIRHQTLSRTETPEHSHHVVHQEYHPDVVSEQRHGNLYPVAPPSPYDEPCSRPRQMDPQEWQMHLHQTALRLKAANARVQYEDTSF